MAAQVLRRGSCPLQAAASRSQPCTRRCHRWLADTALVALAVPVGSVRLVSAALQARSGHSQAGRLVAAVLRSAGEPAQARVQLRVLALGAST